MRTGGLGRDGFWGEFFFWGEVFFCGEVFFWGEVFLCLDERLALGFEYFWFLMIGKGWSEEDKWILVFFIEGIFCRILLIGGLFCFFVLFKLFSFILLLKLVVGKSFFVFVDFIIWMFLFGFIFRFSLIL